MSETTNYHLHLTDSASERFIDWRNAMNGPSNSNMVKIDAALGEKEDAVKVTTVALSGMWTGSGPYSQTVTVNGATVNSKIDLQPTAAQIAQLVADKVAALYIENDNGVFTAHAVGPRVPAAMNVQATIMEVAV